MYATITTNRAIKPTAPMYHFGQLLKELAQKKGITAEEIARKTGKSIQTIYRDYHKTDLNTHVIKEHCNVLGVDISELFISKELVSKELAFRQREIENLREELDRIRKWTDDKDKIIRLYEDKLGKRGHE